MKTIDAIDAFNDLPRNYMGKIRTRDLVDLIIWAYDKGWEEGREDYREEQDSTEKQEWRRTR